MIQGLSLGCHFITRLLDEMTKQRVPHELLHALSTPRGAESLEVLVRTMHKLPWAIPKSAMERLAEEYHRTQWDLSKEEDPEGFTLQAKRFWWYGPLADMQIEYTTFADGEPGETPIPKALREQIVGRKITYPMRVDLDGTEHIVVNVDGEEYWKVGETAGNIKTLGLTPSYMFDFDR